MKKFYFSPLVFPIWDTHSVESGIAILQKTPFNLPYKIPVFLDSKNKKIPFTHIL
jgi:hypothetical protein